jgi:type VI secretion system protein
MAMSLSLKITSYQRLTPNQQSVYQAESDSFTIGRNHENDWAIPDPQRFLSGVHCRIHKEGDQYFITDTSTNGVFLNGSEDRLTRDDPVDLNAGDKFRIGDYEFEVSLNDESLAGNPLTSDEETMIGADPFGDPFESAGSASASEHLSEDSPFDDDDPFSEPAHSSPATDKEDDFLEDIDKPLSSLGDNPLAGHMSIDSLLGFDDDELDLEGADNAEKLRQRQSPLNESFKPSDIDSPAVSPDAAGSDSIQSAFPDEFPDDWDMTTGLLKIPEKEDSPEPAGSTDFPDNWDEATGMFKAPESPKAAEPPTPKPKAKPKAKKAKAKPVENVVPPSPVRQHASGSNIPADSGGALSAFARGAGLELNQVSGFEQDVLFEQVGRMLVMFTEGLIQTLGGRTHIKSEFRLDQTMIRPAENNPFKFSTSKTRTLLQLLSKSDPAYKSGVNAIREGFDDVNAHQIAVVAGMEAALQDILDRFNPNTLEKRLVSDSILDNILPGGKKAKYWDIFRILFDEIAGEAEDNFQQLFGREFSRAYEEQLSRLKNTRKE